MIEYEKYYGKSVFDYKLCGKNLLDNFKIQNDFYNSIFNFTFSDELQKICDKMAKEKYFEKEANRFYDMYVNGIWEIEEEKDTNKLQEYIQGLWDNSEELCEFCKYNGECNGMTCNGNGPVYPACADLEFDSYIDWDKVRDIIIDDKIKNSIEKEEEKDMNKVLNLWCERKRNKIIDKYDEMECEFYNNKYSVVASFKELIEKFNNDLEDLYKLDKATEQFVLKENTPNNVIKYCLDEEKLNEEFKKEYLSKRDEEFNDLRDIKDEVEAQLSLSDDLEYQQEVLIRYGIIDKKTKKIAD